MSKSPDAKQLSAIVRNVAEHGYSFSLFGRVYFAFTFFLLGNNKCTCTEGFRGERESEKGKERIARGAINDVTRLCLELIPSIM